MHNAASQKRWTHEKIEQYRSQVRGGGVETISLAPACWLAQSVVEPDGFWAGIERYVANLTIPSKSHPGHGVDLFYELVLRRRGCELTPLRSYDRRLGWRSLSHASLLIRVNRLSRRLREAGVEQGQRLGIVLPGGEEYVVGLLAALRLGACAVPIPPSGTLLLRKRLEQAEAQHVYSSALYRPMLVASGRTEEQLIFDEPSPGGVPDDKPSHVFGPTDPALLLLSVLHEEPVDEVHGTGCTFVPLAAQRLWQCLLRDAVLCLALSPGDVVLSTGSYAPQVLPCLLLTCVLGGATFVQIEIEEVQQNASRLRETQATLAFLTAPLREVLRRGPKGLMPSLQYALRDPVDGGDVKEWEQLRTTQGLEKVPIGSMVYDSAQGGCVLFARRSMQSSAHLLLPAPGHPYELKSTDLAAQPSAGPWGRFVPMGSAFGGLVVSRVDDHLWFAGTLTPRRDGRLFPESLAAEALSALPFVEGVALSPRLCNDGSGRTQWVLIVHTGPEANEVFERERDARTASVRDCLQRALGAAYQPEVVVLFALSARRKDGAVDRGQLRREYESGLSYRRTKSDWVLALQVLRGEYRKWLQRGWAANQKTERSSARKTQETSC